MRILFELVAALLFILASGLLFSETVRASRILFVIVGIVALASSYVITKQILDATVGQRFHRGHAHIARSLPASPSLQAAEPAGILPAPSATDVVLQSVYQYTQAALDRLVRAGTGQPSASVSADTVVGTIVGLLLAALGAISQAFSAAYRKLVGAD